MTCITEILKAKGDKEFLPVHRRSGCNVVIEGGGKYKGYEYIITFIDKGFRCGYVAIPEDHPAYKCESEYPDYTVHGGVTFFQDSHLSTAILGHSCTDMWIGFDAGHANDSPDFASSLKYFPDLEDTKKKYIKIINDFFDLAQNDNAKIRTFEYMEKECKKLIEQLM